MKKVVSVTFSNGPKPYDYFTDMELRMKEKSDKATAWVIQKVDLTAYRNRLAEEMFG